MKKICLTLLLVMAATAAAPNGVVVGLITGRTGEALRNKKIALVELDTGSRYEATTDHSGIFALGLLPPGDYRIETDRGSLVSSLGDRITVGPDEKRAWRLVWYPGKSKADVRSHLSAESRCAT